MCKKIFFAGLVLSAAAAAEDFESLVRKNQKSALPEYPAGKAAPFSALRTAALEGDSAAQQKIPALLAGHLNEVYRILGRQGGLLYSVRRPVRGYDKAKSNYAVNLDEFLEAATDGAKVKKSGFEVRDTDGTAYSVGVLNYRPAENAIEVKEGGSARFLPLSALAGKDRVFVESALADAIFEEDLEISSDDSRRTGAVSGEDHVNRVHHETGEAVSGAYTAVSLEYLERKIVLKNNGRLPLHDLTVEYQVFAEQKIMRLPKDFPEDYRIAGCVNVKTLAPGERKELLLELPQTVTAKQQTITTGDYEYYRPIPADLNQMSEGRINGIWIRVHRFTPYGEVLTREYKSAGVPSAEWNCIAPTAADIRS